MSLGPVRSTLTPGRFNPSGRFGTDVGYPRGGHEPPNVVDARPEGNRSLPGARPPGGPPENAQDGKFFGLANRETGMLPLAFQFGVPGGVELLVVLFVAAFLWVVPLLVVVGLFYYLRRIDRNVQRLLDAQEE